MIVGLIIFGIVGVLMAAAEAILGTAGEAEASPDTAANREWRQKQWMYHIDNIGGHLNILDLIFGIIHNATEGQSRASQRSRWRLTKITIWRGPDSEPAITIYKKLKRHGVILVWYGFDGDRCWVYVRLEQARWAKYLLNNMPASTWAQKEAERRKARRPWAKLGRWLT